MVQDGENIETRSASSLERHSLKRSAPEKPNVEAAIRMAPTVAPRRNAPDARRASMISDAPDGSTNGSDTASDFNGDTMTVHVALPSGPGQNGMEPRLVQFHVNKRMPLMDLLVHAASSAHFNPSEHAWYSPAARFQSDLTPSTPVGQLPSDTIYILHRTDPRLVNTLTRSKPNSASSSAQTSMRSQVGATSSQPFEKTFRLTVNLPQQQKMVMRVSDKQTMQDILEQICGEKGLEVKEYTLRHPRRPDQQMDMYRQLAEERINEINLVPTFKDTIARHSKRFAAMSEDIPVTASAVPTPNSPSRGEEKHRGSPLDIFKLCRKKRPVVVSNQTNGSNIVASGPIKPGLNRQLSKSTPHLMEPPPAGTGTPVVVPVVAPVVNGSHKDTKKRHAPAPPVLTASPSIEDQVRSQSQPQEQQSLTERESYSPPSSSDESVQVESSRLVGAAPDVLLTGKTSTASHSSSSDTDLDSGYKEAPEKIYAQPAKKKAPAPPPPSSTISSHPVEGASDVKEADTRKGSRADCELSRSVDNKSESDTMSTTLDTYHVDQADPATHADDQASNGDFVYEKGSFRAVDSASSSNSRCNSVRDVDDEVSSLASGSIDLSTPHPPAPIEPEPSSPDWTAATGLLDQTISQAADRMSVQPDSEPATPQPASWDYMQRQASSMGEGEYPWRETTTVEVKVGETMVQQSHSSSSGSSSASGPQTKSPEESTSTPSVEREVIVVEKVQHPWLRNKTPTKPDRTDLSLDRMQAQFNQPVYSSPVPATSASSPVSRVNDSETSVNSSSPIRDRVVSPDREERPRSPSPRPTLNTLKLSIAVEPEPETKDKATLQVPSPAISVSSTTTIPDMPDTTPPPVPKPQQTMSFPPTPVSIVSMSPAPVSVKPALTPRPVTQVNISSLKDDHTSRYRHIAALQPLSHYDVSPVSQTPPVSVGDKWEEEERTSTPQTASASVSKSLDSTEALPQPSASQRRSSFLSRALSLDELISEISTVQQTISELNNQMSSIQLNAADGSVRPDQLAAITEKQKILQEHVQRQITLTQRLLDEEGKSPTVPATATATVLPLATVIKPAPPVKQPALTANKPLGGSMSTKMVNGLPYSQVLALGVKKAPSLRTTVHDDEAQHGLHWSRESLARERRNSWLGQDDVDRADNSASNREHSLEVRDKELQGTRVNMSSGSVERIAADSPDTNNQLPAKFAFATRRLSSNPTRSQLQPTPSRPLLKSIQPQAKPLNNFSIQARTNSTSPGWRPPSSWATPTQVAPTRSLDLPSKDSTTWSRLQLSYGGQSAPSKTKPEGGPLRDKNYSSSLEVTSSQKEQEVDPVEQVVRSWKQGTPSPYHHVGLGPNENAPTRQAMNIPPPPPPAPPTEVTRSMSVPTQPTKKLVVGTAYQLDKDLKSELMDQIKNFSVNSLKKVPSSASQSSKSWTPKIR